MAALLQMKNISKSFPGVKVLQDVNFSLEPGEVHALMGENGAGKSTLMKILGGIYQRDSGEIYVKGNEVSFSSPQAANENGIVIIHQELNLIPHLSVMENIFLGREFTYGRTKMINWNKMKKESEKYLAQLGMALDPSRIVGELSVGQQQMVEIAKALSMNADILVLDEPTAALTDREIIALFDIIDSLKSKGVGMIYISHRMEEIFKISDAITVLRDGKYVGTKATTETSMEELVKMMVGRDITDRFPKADITFGAERLVVGSLHVKNKLHNISLTVRGGEILGIAGLMGAGRTELAHALAGIMPINSGTIELDRKPVVFKRPIDAIKSGVVLVTEDRKVEGLILSQSVRDNVTLPNMSKVSKYGIVNRKKERQLAEETVSRLGVKTAGTEQTVGSLSGGNQQKVVIGKWLATNPKVLILDEPTRGVDIGAKKEIYDLMNDLARQGVAIIMISSELPEVLGMSDRIIVMHEGRITGHFDNVREVTQEDIMQAATGGGK